MAEKSVGTESLGMEKKSTYSGKKLRMAFIGCGGIAQTHLGVLTGGKFPEVEVVAGCDIDPARLDVMKSKWNITKLYKDWKQMLKEVRPDAVNICTPNGVHAPAAIDSSRAGCHVITEKPMAMTPAECQRMIDAAKKAGKKLAVGFQFRYHPSTQTLVRAREAGQFGKIMFCRVQALRRRGVPNWGVFGRKELQGGGPMIDIGVHVIEMAHYIMGKPKPILASGNTWTYMGDKPSNVPSSWPNWDYKTYTVEDLAIGQIRFDNGAIMQIESSFIAHIKEDKWDLEIMGEKGGATWEPLGIHTDHAGTMVNMVPGFTPRGIDFPYMFSLKLRDFVDGCLHNKPLTAPGEDGMTVQKIIDGVYRSANAGKEVAIK